MTMGIAAPSTPWVTVETLSADAMSAVSVGGEARDFAAWQRVVQRLLGKTPSAYDSLSTTRVGELIRAVRDEVREVAVRVRTRTGVVQLHAHPVLGPVGDVHAVRLWVGPDRSRLPQPRPAVGGIWDLSAQTIRLPAGVTQLSGMTARDYAPSMSIAELFHRWPNFDGHAAVLDLLYEPKPGGTLQFDVPVGASVRWRVSIRARDDERTRGAWWLIEEVCSEGVLPWPSGLEQVALREAHRRAGTHLAMLQVGHASISHWLTDPAPWVRWNHLVSPVDVFHPEDRDRLTDTETCLQTGEKVRMTVRVLNNSGAYVPTRLSLYGYPGYSARRLAIIEFESAVDEMAAARPLCERLSWDQQRAG